MADDMREMLEQVYRLDDKAREDFERSERQCGQSQTSPAPQPERKSDTMITREIGQQIAAAFDKHMRQLTPAVGRALAVIRQQVRDECAAEFEKVRDEISALRGDVEALRNDLEDLRSELTRSFGANVTHLRGKSDAA